MSFPAGMKPQFSMISDSTEPAITSCLATWELVSGPVSLHFDNGKDAFKMNNIINAAYEAGLITGKAQVVHDVTNVLSAYRK